MGFTIDGLHESCCTTPSPYVSLIQHGRAWSPSHRYSRTGVADESHLILAVACMAVTVVPSTVLVALTVNVQSGDAVVHVDSPAGTVRGGVVAPAGTPGAITVARAVNIPHTSTTFRNRMLPPDK